MTPKTQSVCKHCHKEIVRASFGWATAFSGDVLCFTEMSRNPRQGGHEPAAEPASTGEPPEQCKEVVTHLIAGVSCISAARPSEPSACDWPFEGCCTQKEACIHANRCLKNLPVAPHTSAEQEAEQKIWAVHGLHGSNGAYFNRASAERFISERLEPHKYNIVEYVPAAPQPVSGDAPGDWNTPEFAELAMGFAKIGKMLQGPERHIMNQIKKVFDEVDAERATRLAGDAPKVEDFVKTFLSRLAGLTEEQSSNVAETLSHMLRPYFPPASQTPQSLDFHTWLTRVHGFKVGSARNSYKEADLEAAWNAGISHRPEVIGAKPLCLDCHGAGIINCSHFDNCSGKWVYVATPASTARTDGWVSVEERLPNDSRMVEVAAVRANGEAMRGYSWYSECCKWDEVEDQGFSRPPVIYAWRELSALPAPPAGAAQPGDDKPEGK